MSTVLWYPRVLLEIIQFFTGLAERYRGTVLAPGSPVVSFSLSSLQVCLMWSAIVLMMVGGVISPNVIAAQEESPTAVSSAAIGESKRSTQDPANAGVLEIVAPITLDVSENGKLIGTTKEPRLLLRPGKHVLVLSNHDLGYTSTHTVNIEPGEAKTIKLDPRAAARLQATPWAEVWMRGKKLGETPLVHSLPLGRNELVFKHPRFGERRVTTTVRADATVPVSVDMRK